MKQPLNKRYETKYPGVFFRIRKTGEKSYVTRLKNGQEKTIKPSPTHPKITEYVAYQLKLQMDEEIRRNEWNQQNKAMQMTFGELFDLYLNSSYLSAETRRQNIVVAKKHIFPELAENTKVYSINEYQLNQVCLAIMSKKIKKITQKKYITLLCTIVNVGNRNKLFQNRIFTQDLIKPRLTSKDLVRDRALTVQEMQIILNDVKKDDFLHLFFVFCFMTAGRGKTIYRIKLKDIDLSKQTIWLENTKTGGQRYSIPMQEEVLKLVFNFVKKHKINENEYLFNLKNLPKNEFEKNWNKLYQTLRYRLKKIGLENDLSLKGLGLHAGRKGVATQMYQKGVSIHSISRTLDHSEIATTNRHYISESEEMYLDEIKKFKMNLNI